MGTVKVDDLCFGYDKRSVFNGLSVEFHKGDFCTIMGLNGSGKTTLLKCITGLLKPSSGTVMIDGKDIGAYSVREKAKHIAYVSQYQELVFEISVRDYVMMGRNPYQRPWSMAEESDTEVVEEAMRRCNVSQFQDTMMQSLSGGERQRAMIARAIAQQTDILILDEPLSNIDITHKFEIMDILEELNRGRGVTILIVLHDLPIAVQYSKQILLLKNGKMEQFGDKNAVLTEENIRKCFGLDKRYKISKEGFVVKEIL